VDILAFLQFVDECGQLSNLPRYVSNNPDKMPSCRLFEGDLRFFLARLDKLESNLAGFGQTLTVITTELQGVQQISLNGQVLSTHLQATPDSVVGNCQSPAHHYGGKTITNINKNNNNITQLIRHNFNHLDSTRPVRNLPL